MHLYVYHVSIDYDEPDQSSYRGVEVRVTKEGKPLSKRFDSRDAERDWLDAYKWISEQKDVMICMLSSSCDHFVMDGDDFEWEENETIGYEMIVHRKGNRHEDTKKDVQL